VRGGAIGVWTADVLFDLSSMMYLASGWRRFCCVHQIRNGHFLVFNYDGQHTLTVTIFDGTMCYRHYTPTALANVAISSSSKQRVAVGYYLFFYRIYPNCVCTALAMI
jgi:hypothetical protein